MAKVSQMTREMFTEKEWGILCRGFELQEEIFRDLIAKCIVTEKRLDELDQKNRTRVKTKRKKGPPPEEKG